MLSSAGAVMARLPLGDREGPLSSVRAPGHAVLAYLRETDRGDIEPWSLRVQASGLAVGQPHRLLTRLDWWSGLAFAGGPDAHLLAVEEPGLVWAAILDPTTGARLTRVDLADGAYGRSRLEAIAVGSSFLVFWFEDRWAGVTGLVGQWVGPGGVPIGSSPGANLPLLGVPRDSMGWLSAATDGVDVLLTWMDLENGRFVSMRVAAPGGAR